MILGPSVLELSSGQHLVDLPTDRQTDRPTDRPTDICKTIYPPHLRWGGIISILNGVLLSRWVFPTLGLTVPSGTKAMPRFRSARSSQRLETPIYNRTPYWILFLAQHHRKITFNFILSFIFRTLFFSLISANDSIFICCC